MYDLLTLGEVLLRYTPQGGKRFLNASGFDCYVGGAELNVAAGVAQLGRKAGIITRLPEHGMGQLARRKITSLQVGDRYVVTDRDRTARIGVYFYEKASSPRKPEVIYDRDNSSFLGMNRSHFPKEMFADAKCFHTSGINLALGGKIREETLGILKEFKKKNVLISFDVNFRGNLWSGAQAKECIEKILPMTDIFFCTEDTARMTFLKTGNLKDIMKAFSSQYGIRYICSSKRTVHSAAQHSFTSVLYDSEEDLFYEELPYERIDVADRIGSGDAYAAGILYGLLSGCTKEDIVSYGNAMGVMKNTISGDIGEVTKEEIDALIQEHKTGKAGELKR